MKDAETVTAPIAGNVKSLAVTTSASSAQDLLDYVNTHEWIDGYWTFTCSSNAHIIFGDSEDVPDPDTAVDGDGDEPWPMAAGVSESWVVNRAARFFKIIGDSAGVLVFKKG